MVQFREGVPKARLTGQLIWFLGWLAVTVAAIWLSPSSQMHGTHQQLGLPACPSVAFFDRPCFGCGMTTSFTALIHLDFVTAFKAHPFGPLFYLLFTLSAIGCGWGWMKNKYMDTDNKRFNRATIIVTVAFVSFGIVRFATVKYGSQEFASTQAAIALTRSEQGR